MNCEEFDKLVVAYTADDLDPEVKKDFEDHFLTCEECSAKFKKWLEAVGTLEMEGAAKLFGPTPEVDKVEELLEFAELAEENGDYKEAVRLIKLAIEVRPDDEKVINPVSEIIFKIVKHKNMKILDPEKIHSFSHKSRDFWGQLLEPKKRTISIDLVKGLLRSKKDRGTLLKILSLYET